MKKKYKSVMAACSLIVILGAFMYINIAAFTDVFHLLYTELLQSDNLSGFARNAAGGKVVLREITHVVGDGSNNIYITDNYGRNIYKSDSEGSLVYRIEIKQDSRRSYCSRLAADDKGNIYVLNTVLDEDGLYVDGEEIDRYTPQGSYERTVYTVRYENGRKPMRTGRIKDLKADGDYLSIICASEDQRIELVRVKLGEDTAETGYSLKLDPDKYISSVQRAKNNSILYSTKSGQLYKADQNGLSSLVYSGNGLYGSKLSLLSHFRQIDDIVYFIDFYKPGIMKFNMNSPGIIYNFTEELTGLRGLNVTQDGKLLAHTGSKVSVINTDGSIHRSIEALQIPADKIRAFWVFCLGILLMVIVIADMLRVLYVDFMGRRLSLILKEILIFIPVVAVVTGFLIYRIDNRLDLEVENEMRNKLNIIAMTAPGFIDGDSFERINSPSDYMGEDYIAALKYITEMFTSSEDSPNDGLYNTLYRIKDGKAYIIMDDDDGRLFFEPADYDDTYFDEMISQISEGKFYYTGAERDNSGEWINVKSAIYNSKYEVVGIYETGMDYTSYKRGENKRLLYNLTDIILASAINILAFMIITFSVLRTVKTLRKGVEEIAAGNWDTVVKVRSGDEIASLCEGFNTMAQYIRNSITEILKMNEAYFYFVPQQFLKLLEKDNIYEIKLGDSMKRDMSIMYSSIRPFEQLLHNNTSEENFRFINTYLSSFGPIIRDNNGIVEKYLGIDILALFPQKAGDGLDAAVKMTEELVTYNNKRKKAGQIPVEIGIGIYHGPLMLGIIGEEKRLEGTVISDKGDISEVLARMTERLSAQIIITENTLKNLEDASKYRYRNLGFITLPGKGEKISIYDVYQSDSDSSKEQKDKTKGLFEEGIRLYQEGRFYDARAKFVEVIKQNDYDRAAKVYFYLSDEYYRKGKPENWDGSLSI